MARNQYSEQRPGRDNVIFRDQKVVRLIIGSMAGQGEARADIIRYICNDNCAKGGREMKNMNIGIAVRSRENEKIVFLLQLQ